MLKSFQRNSIYKNTKTANHPKQSATVAKHVDLSIQCLKLWKSYYII